MPEPEASVLRLAWGVALLLPAAVLFAVLSALLERSGPIRLRHWVEEGGERLRALYDSPSRFGAFRYLLSLSARLAPICLYAVLSLLLIALDRRAPLAWALAGVLVGVGATEAANRVLVGTNAELVLRRMTRVYRLVLFLFQPLVALVAPLVPRPSAPREDNGLDETVSDEEIEAFIDVGTREGILEPQEGEMVWSIVDFGDTQVRSVMTPRIDMVCAPVDTPVETLAERFVESGHSRLPIYEESIDRIIGILHIRDVLRAVRHPETPPVRELIKPPLFIPETKPLGELLKELQARFQQLAVVVDEYGGTAGMVTVEDLLEEIVGEIMDEHEALVAELEPIEEGVYRIDGRAHIEILDELFGVDIEDAEYETVAGLIFTHLGHVPEAGETVAAYGLRFTVEAVADRRIEKIRVERSATEPAAGAAR